MTFTKKEKCMYLDNLTKASGNTRKMMHQTSSRSPDKNRFDDLAFTIRNTSCAIKTDIDIFTANRRGVILHHKKVSLELCIILYRSHQNSRTLFSHPTCDLLLDAIGARKSFLGNMQWPLHHRCQNWQAT